MSNPTQPLPPQAAKSRGRTKLLSAIALAFVAIGVAYGIYYSLYQRYYEETDDAYVGGNLVYVNSLVSGTVIGIGADDNQPVKAGQALVRLDHADSVVGLADAEARLGETVRQIRQQFRAVDEATAVVDQRKSDLARVTDDLSRRTPLAGTESESGEDLAHARAAVVTAKDAYTVALTGDRHLPKAYDKLSIGMLSSLREGPTTLRQTLASLAQKQVELWKPRLEGKSTREKLDLLRDLYGEEDPFTSLEYGEHEAVLIERNCPFLNVALEHPVICSLSVNTLEGLLGHPVIRQEKFQSGHGRCVFRVLLDQKLPEKDFKLEAERTAAA